MILDAILAVLVAAFGFSFRYLDHRDFANEQFITLSQAQAWLAGDWPVRDYTQYGSILSDAMSAIAQKLFGPTPLSELLLCTGAFAVAAAVTFWVTTRITGRRSLGVFAALLQIWAAPVLFSYPKLFIYPMLLALGLAYTRRQTRLRLILLAGWASTGFLIRQDHGIYAFIAGFVLVVSVHHMEGGGRKVIAQRAGLFVLAFLLFLAPFFVFVQIEMGLRSYFQLGIEVSRLEANRSAGSMPMFVIESGPLFVLKPPPERDVIYIRWSPDVTDEARRAIEQRGHLLFGRAMDGRTRAYRVDRGAVDALGTIINEPAVEVVDGINRNTLSLPDESFAQRFLRVTKLHRLQLGPPIPSIASRENCGTFLFYLCYLLPGGAFLLWWRTTWPERTELHEARSLLPALCVLALVCTIGLVRVETRRLPDVFGTFPILLCWSISSLQGFGTSRRPQGLRAVPFVLIGAVALSVYRIGGDYSQLLQQIALHPLKAFARAEETTRSAREWPWASQWPEDEEWRLAVYIHDCTRADDRLLVAWRAPEFFYFSRRVFAGREGAFLEPITIASLSLRFPETYEQKVLNVWQHQSVPIVLTSDSDKSDEEFATLFPALEHHLETAYAVAGTTRWRGRPSITVHVDKNRVPSRKDPEFGLPCFTEDPHKEQRS